MQPVNDMAVFASVVVGILAGVALFKVFFRDQADFAACLNSLLRPDFLALVRGKLVEKWFRSTRISVYLLACLLAGAETYHVLTRWF